MTRLTLQDLDGRARLGVRGTDLGRWVNANGYTVGDAPNRGYPQSDKSLLARLSACELVWLGKANQSIGERTRVAEDYRCYTVLRRDTHAWFRVAGAEAPRMLAGICGVDLSASAFANHAVAQTLLAGVSAIVIRDDGRQPSFHLLADRSYARYLNAALIDAGGEFGLSVPAGQ